MSFSTFSRYSSDNKYFIALFFMNKIFYSSNTTLLIDLKSLWYFYKINKFDNRHFKWFYWLKFYTFGNKLLNWLKRNANILYHVFEFSTAETLVGGDLLYIIKHWFNVRIIIGLQINA